jgi:hypothetical protein
LMGAALRNRDDDDALRAVRDEVLELCGRFPPYPQLVRDGARRTSPGGR